jgi:hypothetical protein
MTTRYEDAFYKIAAILKATFEDGEGYDDLVDALLEIDQVVTQTESAIQDELEEMRQIDELRAENIRQYGQKAYLHV